MTGQSRGVGKPVILFVALQTGAGANGGIASLGEIVQALDRYTPVLLTNLDSPTVAQWREAGIEVHIVPERASSGLRRAPLSVVATYIRYFRATRRILASTGARIVHANDPLAFQLAWAAVRLSGKVRLAFSMRDTLDPARKPPTGRLNWIFGSADHTFFLSHDMQRRWTEISAKAAERSSATFSIVDFGKFSPVPLPADATKVALVSGVISHKKGQLRFLEKVAPLLIDAGIHCWFSGDFDPGTSDYARRCLEAAKPLGDSVRFLGYRDDIPELIRRAHVVCVSSQYEGLMRTMIEAISRGRPVVSTDVASAREILEVPGRRAGFVFPVDFEGSMAEAILRLCDDEDLNRTLGANGTGIARDLFDRSSVIEAYHRVYDRLAI